MCCGAHGANEREFSAKERVLMSKLRSTTSTFLTSVEGHYRPRQRTLPPGPLPLRPNKRTHALQQIRGKHWRKSDLMR